MKPTAQVYEPGPGMEWLKHVSSAVFVRKSTRAKNTTIRMQVSGEIEVVSPRALGREKVTQLLNEKRDWIEATHRRNAKTKLGFPATKPDPFPEQIVLPAISETWSATYVYGGAEVDSLTYYPDKTMVMRLGRADSDVVAELLQKWLSERAKKHLVPWLARISREIGFSCKNTSIRRQKTRWGSCSKAGTISLNACLLFLPEALVRHILIHELCHTRELNHSDAFWSLVSKHQPGYEELEKEIKDAFMRYVPPWATCKVGKH